MSKTIALWIGMLLAASVAQAEPSALEAAYQKEFAFLTAEKKALQARLTELQGSRDQAISAAEGELSVLESRFIAVGLEGDRLDEKLDTLDREADGAAEASEALNGTLLAARTTLERPGFDMGEEATEFSAQVGQLRTALDEGVSRLAEGRTTRTAEGVFFKADGTEVSGTVSWVGNVGAYGVSESASGALVPAGEGHLRLWKEPADQAARAVAAGTVPATLPLYLFESLDKRVDEPVEKTLLTWVANGGVVGLVILALLAAGIVLVVLRGLALLRLGQGSESLLSSIVTRIEEGDFAGAEKAANASSTSLGAALAYVLPHLGEDRELVDNVVTEALLAEQPRIERFGVPIMVIAAVAPLLGLLGTVTGMIGTFDVITQFGTGDPKMLSGGISEALVTTQMGLIVAIPMLLLGNLLGARATTLLDQVERGTMRLVNVHDRSRETTPQPLQTVAK